MYQPSHLTLTDNISHVQTIPGVALSVEHNVEQYVAASDHWSTYVYIWNLDTLLFYTM